MTGTEPDQTSSPPAGGSAGEWVSQRTAATRAGVSPSTIHRLVRTGRITGLQRDTGSRWLLVNTAEVDAAVQHPEQHPASTSWLTINRAAELTGLATRVITRLADDNRISTRTAPTGRLVQIAEIVTALAATSGETTTEEV